MTIIGKRPAFITDRRRFLAGAGATGLALSSPLARAWASELYEQLRGSGSIVICTWGGQTDEAMRAVWTEEFARLYGISSSFTSIPDMARLEVMERVGNVEWDLVDTEGAQMAVAIEKGLLQPIDYDLIHSVVPPEQLDPAVTKEYGIGSVAFSTVIAWNSNLFEEGPADWTEFFDTERFNGRRALYAQPRPSFEIALLAAGVPREDIYPIDVDDAFEALDAIRDKVDLWVERTSQWGVLMQNNEVDLMGSSLARTLEEKQAGRGIDFHFNQSIVEQSYWTIPRSAPGAEEAQKLLAWMMRPEGQLAYATMRPMGVANISIYGDVPPEMIEQLPGYPDNSAQNLEIDENWWGANAEEVQLRWLDWISRA